jgi:dolichyl-phosphate-mannose--protein O-mannosyl transferase
MSDVADDRMSKGEAPLPWLLGDTIVTVILLLAAAFLRFWRIGYPAGAVFDELDYVGFGNNYLRGEYFLSTHPPLASLVSMVGLWAFGIHSWSWRLGHAILGVALVVITYLLGRRLFGNRLSATLAAIFVLLDGLFLVQSRLALTDVTMVTFAAMSYLLMFRFIQKLDRGVSRITLLGLGTCLGLCLASKLLYPAVTFLLVLGFLIFRFAGPDDQLSGWRFRDIVGASLLVGSSAAIAFLATFLPNFALGWWGGIESLFHYYSEVIWFQRAVLAREPDPNASPWWSWPLMLHPFMYWRRYLDGGRITVIWCGGNPILWWGATAAILATLARVLWRPTLRDTFIVVGYFAYLAVSLPAGRSLYTFHYMSSLYLAFLALAAVLGECWTGAASRWEHLALIGVTIPALWLGLGPVKGLICVVIVLVAYFALLYRQTETGKLVTAWFLLTAAVASIFFFPIWMGLPLETKSFDARMWLHGSGLANWR